MMFFLFMNRFFLLMSISFLCSACNPLMIVRPDSEALNTKGWARQPRTPKHPEPLYCYKTLGDVMCYPNPQYGLDKRLSGYYGPKP